jgi:muramoyltetrapeptide carboxypeptidase
MPLRRPQPLKPNGRVAVVAPSGRFSAAGLRTGIAWLAAQGLEPVIGDDLFARVEQTEGYLAGDDDTRFVELVSALSDPSIGAVWCARGGYGAMRLLSTPGVPEALARTNAWLVGFSDITALHLVAAHAGTLSLHASMVARIAEAPEPCTEAMLGILRGATGQPGDIAYPHLHWLCGAATNAQGTSGSLWGGNLSLTAALTGTPWSLAAATGPVILMLEDIGEAPYRIDRMVTQLALAGALDRVAAVVLGQFTPVKPGAAADPSNSLGEAYMAFAEALGPVFARRGIPVFAGAPFGHEREHWPFIHGAEAVLGLDGTLRYA